MAQWDVRTFDQQADQIVNAWASTLEQNGASLGTLVEKTARDNSLNPEQIRRLCRVVNSRAFNARFASMGKQAQAGDRFVDFDVAREDDVISALHKTASMATKTASQATYPALPNEMAELRGETKEVFSKIAYEDRQTERALERVLGKDPPKTDQLMHYQKVASELRGRLALSSSKYRESIDALVKEASYINFDHNQFEKDALAVCGPDALDVLNAVRTRRNMAQIHVPTEKVAALLDMLVGNETKHTKLVSKAISSLEAFNQYKTAALETDKQIQSLKEALHP